MKMKSLKAQFIGAIAMVLVAAIAMGSSTYAWFAMNSEVTAEQMKVTAGSETGIVIAAYTNANATAPNANAFAALATANVTEATDLIPTYTADATNWYHTSSKSFSNGQVYADAGYADVSDISSGNNIYLLNKFQIKSTNTTAHDVYVKQITMTRTNDGAAVQAYDPAVRVLVKHGSTVLIFSPVDDDTSGETILAATADTDDVTADIAAAFVAPNTTGAKILTSVDGNPQDVFIYVYYDGEDPFCKSNNIPATTFNTLRFDVLFTTTDPATVTHTEKTLTQTLSNATSSSSASTISDGTAFSATYTPATGYKLPDTITVTVGGTPLVANSDYTWNPVNGKLAIRGNVITDTVVVTVTGVATT